MRILLLLIPGFFVGWFVIDWMRQPFSDDATLMRRWFEEQPVTVIAACTMIGAVVLGGLFTVLGLW